MLPWNRINIDFLAVVLFTFFLFPIWSSSLGANSAYQFFLYPLIALIFYKKILIPNNFILFGIILYTLILCVSIFIKQDFIEFIDRRFISFILFISMFFLVFTPFKEKHILAFKISLVFASFLNIFPILFEAISSGLNNLSYISKINLADGGTRYGFVYLMAFWVIFLFQSKDIKINFLKYLGIFIILLGLLLTFNRSALLGLGGSLFLYGFYYTFFYKEKIQIKLKKIFLIILFFILTVLLIYNFVPFLINFFISRFSLLFTNPLVTIYSENIINYVSLYDSAGYRLYIWNLIYQFILINPFTGSGYLGVWILLSDLSGSAHGQFQDIFFRVGILGSLYFGVVLISILNKLFVNKQFELFWGFSSILIFSLFNETFSLGTGKFILAFLIAICFQKNLMNKSMSHEN